MKRNNVRERKKRGHKGRRWRRKESEGWKLTGKKEERNLRGRQK